MCIDSWFYLFDLTNYKLMGHSVECFGQVQREETYTVIMMSIEVTTVCIIRRAALTVEPPVLKPNDNYSVNFRSCFL